MTSSIRHVVRGRIESEGLIDDLASLDDDDDLFDAGMNSLSAVRLALHLEEQFDVCFPDEMLTRASLRSVSAIAELLELVLATG